MKKKYVIVSICVVIAAIAIGLSVLFRQKLGETPPEHACGAIITLKSQTDTEETNIFHPGDNVYAKGSGMSKNKNYTIYIIPDTTIVEGMPIPTPVVPPVNVKTDGYGRFDPTLIWQAPLKPGLYDIIADCMDEGVPGYYDDRDAIDDEETHVTAGFFVISETALGTIGVLSAAFAATFLKHKKVF